MKHIQKNALPVDGLYIYLYKMNNTKSSTIEMKLKGDIEMSIVNLDEYETYPGRTQYL